MSPNDAVKPENQIKVQKHQEKYSKELANYNGKVEKFAVSDKILIRNIFHKDKIDDSFKDKGFIRKILHKNVYEVKNENERCI